MFCRDIRNVVIEPPDPAALITATDCKTALGIATTAQDGLIAAAIPAVVAQLDAGLGGWLGRALGPQTWELRMARFSPCRDGWLRDQHEIVLPVPPLLEVESVTYVDPQGATQTLVEDTDFRVLGQGSLGRQCLAPVYGKRWPATRVDHDSVVIRYRCGYDEDTNKLPSTVKQAVVLGVRALLNLSERNLFVSEDIVEGVGTKRYIVTGGAADILQRAMASLLANLQVTAL